MGIVTRLKRATKEALGLKQWPRPEAPQPSSYEDQLYAALVRHGDVCFDVGANYGEVALFLAQTVGESGLVVAFEPVWPMYTELCRFIQRDTTQKAPILTVPMGMSDAVKDATIHVPNGDFTMGSMADPAAWAGAQPGAKLDTHRVRFTTLDAYLATTGFRPPTFLKIDVEGAELFVPRGGEKLLTSGTPPLMLIEVFAPWEKAFGYQPWEPLSWLMERGYRFLFVCPTGLVEYEPTASQPFPPEYEMGYNVVAYQPAAHADRIAAARHLRPAPQTKLLPMTPPPRPNHIA